MKKVIVGLIILAVALFCFKWGQTYERLYGQDQAMSRLIQDGKVVTKEHYASFEAEAKDRCLVEVNTIIADLKAEGIIPPTADLKFSVRSADTGMRFSVQPDGAK